MYILYSRWLYFNSAPTNFPRSIGTLCWKAWHIPCQGQELGWNAHILQRFQSWAIGSPSTKESLEWKKNLRLVKKSDFGRNPWKGRAHGRKQPDSAICMHYFLLPALVFNPTHPLASILGTGTSGCVLLLSHGHDSPLTALRGELPNCAWWVCIYIYIYYIYIYINNPSSKLKDLEESTKLLSNHVNTGKKNKTGRSLGVYVYIYIYIHPV